MGETPIINGNLVLRYFVLQSASEACGSNVDTRQVLRFLLKATCEALRAERGCIYALSESGDELECVASFGIAEGAGRSPIPLGTGFLGQVVLDGEPRVIPDVTSEASRAGIVLMPFEVGSMLCVPVKNKGQVVGAASAYSKRDPYGFGMEDCEFLRGVSGLAGMLIVEERLSLDARLANVDGLTSLANFRAFQRIMACEMERAARYSRPLSLIIMDLNDFKVYNDTYGHPAGNVLLRKLAEILRENVRESDTVCRWGGDEFTIILPETSKQDAIAFAKRMKAVVENTSFPGAESMPGRRITVSMGVGNYPEDATTRDELVEKTDEAFYQAKQAGSFRLSAYQSPEERLGHLLYRAAERRGFSGACVYVLNRRRSVLEPRVFAGSLAEPGVIAGLHTLVVSHDGTDLIIRLPAMSGGSDQKGQQAPRTQEEADRMPGSGPEPEGAGAPITQSAPVPGALRAYPVLGGDLTSAVGCAATGWTVLERLVWGTAGDEVQRIACDPSASLLGVLVLAQDQARCGAPVLQADVHFLVALAREACLALRTSVAEAGRGLPYLDPLTSLHNHTYFREELQAAVRKAGRYAYPFALVMMDIDGFRAFNERNGHLVGDGLLREVAQILRDNTREGVDVVARYGGEEFVLLLPRTSREEAVDVAERVRREVESTSFAGEQGPGLTKMTVSAGVAAYPQDATTAEELIMKADVALFRAKAAGRNCVRAYTEGIEWNDPRTEERPWVR